MRMTDILEKKKNGFKLDDAEIAFFVQGYTAGDIPDYQAAALAMAICLRGMDKEETACLTEAMANSGDRLELSAFGSHTADKHSSGGVGDKTTLIAAPIAAACGVTVAKMSGRGLGFTGGTIDKLEAIPGFCTEITPTAFYKQAEQIGLVIAGQTGSMAPCDKKLYALRDVTATVDCLPLIASSIMSKKLAAGAKNIVLDVKFGSGAFMKTKANAQALGRAMVQIGQACGRNTTAFLTNMDAPLGRRIGNAFEVAEAASILQGENISDLKNLCLRLAAEMIALAAPCDTNEALQKAGHALDSGLAFEKLCQMTAAQGGDTAFLEHPEQYGNNACAMAVTAAKDGFIEKQDALAFGRACVLLGAGRAVKTDQIDPFAGILLKKKPGDPVQKGEETAVLFAQTNSRLAEAAQILKNAVKIVPVPPKAAEQIAAVIR